MKRNVYRSIMIVVIISMLFSAYYSNFYKLNYLSISTNEFRSLFSNGILADLVSIFVFIILGVVIHNLSRIYLLEKLNLFFRTLIHLILLLFSYYTVAVILKWFDYRVIFKNYHSLITFIVIYMIIWCLLYLKGRKDIDKINEKLKK